ncbi:c-type cytochrome [Maricaulis sp. MIT060901]|uniref:c-type cytochrome n=1 Tax=Maricaulis sp. MIT060901 TaxID=3096993 RepID=UPI0039996FDC
MSRLVLPALSAFMLVACGGGDSSATSSELPTDAGAEPTAEAGANEAGAAAETAVTELAESTSQQASDALPDAVLALGETFANADLVNGRRQYRRCQSCHTLEAGGRHTVGPNLHGIMGAQAAAKEGFNYSPRLTDAGLVWDVATLDAWIQNPRGLVPGNRMSFVGLRDADDRRDVIAYIAAQTSN